VKYTTQQLAQTKNKLQLALAMNMFVGCVYRCSEAVVRSLKQQQQLQCPSTSILSRVFTCCKSYASLAALFVNDSD